jgi:hypothetical protein
MTTRPENIVAWRSRWKDALTWVHSTTEPARHPNLIVEPLCVASASALDAEREAIADEARRYAGLYPEASDGRNTFLMFADFVERRMGGHATASEMPADTRHQFVPNKKYPWFCAHCGYAPHEPLKHVQPATSAGVRS